MIAPCPLSGPLTSLMKSSLIRIKSSRGSRKALRNCAQERAGQVERLEEVTKLLIIPHTGRLLAVSS